MNKQQAIQQILSGSEDMRVSRDFTAGENIAYSDIAKKIAERLAESKLEGDFEVDSDGLYVALILSASKKVKLFCLFNDRFTLPENYGGCPTYCQNEYRRFMVKLETCELLLCES